MKRTVKFLLLTLTLTLITITPFGLVQADGGYFTDVPASHWAKAAVEEARGKGIMAGRGENTFDPETNITRQEFLQMVQNIFQNNVLVNQRQMPSDSETPFKTAIENAVQLGYIDLYDDGTIKPLDDITRIDVFVILARLFNLSGDAGKLLDYADLAGLNEEQLRAIAVAQEIAGVVGFVENGLRTLQPNGNFTRAQAASVFNNLIAATLRAGQTATQADLAKNGNYIIISGQAIINGNGTPLGADVFITSGVGEGTVIFDNISINTLIIEGGGSNSIYFVNDTQVDEIISNKCPFMPPVRLVFDETSFTSDITMNTPVLLDNINEDNRPSFIRDNVRDNGNSNTPATIRTIISIPENVAEAQAGDLLTVVLNPPDPNATVRWRIGGTIVHTGFSYTVKEEDVGKLLVLFVTRSDGDHGTVNYLAGIIGDLPTSPITLPPGTYVNTIVAVQMRLVNRDDVIHVLRVGDVLTAQVIPDVGQVDYVWMNTARGSDPIGTDKTYTVTEDDLGGFIFVRVTGRDGMTGVAVSVSLPVGNTMTNIELRVADTQFGFIMRLWSPMLDDYITKNYASFEWRTNGELIGTDDSYTVCDKARGKTLTVTVTIKSTWLITHLGTFVFYGTDPITLTADLKALDETIQINAVSIIAVGGVSTTPSQPIAGQTSVGYILAAKLSPDVLPHNTSSIKFEWKADGVVVGTESHYAVKEADVGKQITVTVISGGLYSTKEVTSEPTTTVIDDRFRIKSIKIQNLNPKLGDFVTYVIDPHGAQVLFEWKVDGVVVSTASSFRLTDPSHVGKEITVTVTGRGLYYGTATHSTSYVPDVREPITRVELIYNRSFVQNAPSTGSEIYVGIDPPGQWQNYIIEWFSDGVPIVPDGINHYTARESDNGKIISVRVTGIGYLTGTMTASLGPIVPFEMVALETLTIQLILPENETAVRAGMTVTAGLSPRGNPNEGMSTEWYIDNALSGMGTTFQIPAGSSGKTLLVIITSTGQYHGRVQTTVLIE
jgi:hypothetical protein